ncbi:MAG: carboxypeptidase regulatory-like domain-containing protein, partial [Candidatus Edwardsbacteria bacterium]|nr:carboxypeptidase regulatory-like domain-containing protein [Candidatus Edwardsbacteria bacterium]
MKSLRLFQAGLMVLAGLFAASALRAGERVTINAGAIMTEVWRNGLLGDTTDFVTYPAGWYPYADPTSLLRIGSLWAGGSIDGKKSFGVSAGLLQSGSAVSEWISDSAGTLPLTPGSRAPLEIKARINDTTSSYNAGVKLGIEASLSCHQWSFRPVDRFYILEYNLKNIGASTIDSFYCGAYHRPNVNKTPALNTEFLNYCGLDTAIDAVNGGARNLLWITADSVQCFNNYGIVPPYLGVRLLEAKNPQGLAAGLSGLCSWWGADMAPRSDASRLDKSNRYSYLSRGKFDAAERRKVNSQARTLDPTLLKIQNVVLREIEGVWDVNDTNHLATNYYAGGSFVPELGAVTLGTAKPDRIVNSLKEELWASDSVTVTVVNIPVNQVLGVYDTVSGTGTNYYTGGSFNPATGVVTLGTPYPNWGSSPVYADYSYKADNVIISYSYRHSIGKYTPLDTMTLQINSTGLDEVVGVYDRDDSLMAGTNYYLGGTFDKSSGTIYLGSPIAEDTAIQSRYETYLYDASYNVNDSLLFVHWMDSTKLVEVLSVTDAADTFDYFAGGSYNQSTGEILLGTKFSNYASEPVYVTYRYLYLPEVLVKYHANDLAARHVLQSLGPWTLSPGDSAKAVFAVIAGNSLAEAQAASDSAMFLWNNPAASIVTDRGSLSGSVSRTEGRGPIEGAKVKLYLTGTATDSALTDAQGRFFIRNAPAGDYDSLTAEAPQYLARALTAASIIAGRDTANWNFSLPSTMADLYGRVTRSDGLTPVPNAAVHLKGVNNDSTTTDAGGRYYFESVATTSLDSLIFEHPDFLADTLSPIVLISDSMATIDIILHSTSGWIDGKITKLDSITPIAGAAVSVSGPTAGSDTTDSQGNYSVSGLAAGTYSLAVNASGYAPENVAGIQVAVDSTTTVLRSLSQALNDLKLVWTRKADLPEWRYGAAACRIGGNIYVFGGRNYTEPTATAYRYNPAADTTGGSPWQMLADMPTARYGLGCAAVGDTIIYVVGGYDQNGATLSALEAYKPATNSWITGLPPMPNPRASMGVVSVKDTVFTVAGEKNTIASTDTVETYLASENLWIARKKLTGGARSGATACTLDSLGIKRAYILGGKLSSGSFVNFNFK